MLAVLEHCRFLKPARDEADVASRREDLFH
jgi:hypothetical protein